MKEEKTENETVQWEREKRRGSIDGKIEHENRDKKEHQNKKRNERRVERRGE